MASKLDEAQLASLIADARSGQFSKAELGRQYGISEGYVRKILKAEGVSTDLADRVRHAAKEKAVRGEVRPNQSVPVLSDDEIVEQAADRAAAAIQRHARVAGRGIEVAERLVNRAADMLAEIDRAEQAETPKTEQARSQAKMRTLTMAARIADVGTKAMSVLDKAVTLERQALNLDEATPPGGNVTRIEWEVVNPPPTDA